MTIYAVKILAPGVCTAPIQFAFPGVTAANVILPGFSGTPTEGWNGAIMPVWKFWPTAPGAVQYQICNPRAIPISYSNITLNVGAL